MKTINLHVRNFPEELNFDLRAEAFRRRLTLEKFIVLACSIGLRHLQELPSNVDEPAAAKKGK